MEEEVQKSQNQTKRIYQKTKEEDLPSFEIEKTPRGQIFIKTKKAGRIPRELSGEWTSVHEAQRAIDIYLELRTKK